MKLNGTILLSTIGTQDYSEKQGKTEATALEVMENYKALLQQQGAEIKRDHSDNVVAHLMKNGEEYWLGASATRDDGYEVREVAVEPFKRSLLSPSGSDYRLLGHMPGFSAGAPDKKRYDEHRFPIEDGEVAVRGGVYTVLYDPPAKAEREIMPIEVAENYREALHDLGAEVLRDQPGSITARFDDHGQIIWIYADMRQTIAQVVEFLERNPDLKLSIEGHTDIIGGHDCNMKLSLDRAASVVAAVVAAGIDGSRLQSAGYGPDKPIATNDTDEGRAKNRRVEMVKN